MHVYIHITHIHTDMHVHINVYTGTCFRNDGFTPIPVLLIFPTGSSLASPVTYLYVSSSIVRTLTPNHINTFTDLLNPIVNLRDSKLLLP